MKIIAILYPGMTALDLIGPLQAFLALPGAQVQTVWETAGPVMSDSGLPLVATTSYAEAWTDPDIVVIGGAGGPTLDAMRHAPTLAFLRSRAASAKWVVSVCTGSLILAAAGLLKGRRAASYWAVRDHLAAFGAIPDPARVVFDGPFCTGGGVTAGIDVGIAIVGHIAGEDHGRLCELMLEYAPAPPYGVGRPEHANPGHVSAVKGIIDGLIPAGAIAEIAAKSAAD